MSTHPILYVQPVGEKGGMEVNLIKEVRQLDRARFTPIVACLDKGPIVEELRDAGAIVHTFRRDRARNIPRTLTSILGLTRLIKAYSVSLIVSQNGLAHLYGRPASFLTGRPCVLRSGGVGDPPDLVERIAYHLGASCVVANSAYSRRRLIGAGVPATRVCVVLPGVDLREFAEPGGQGGIRQELGISPDATLITTIGRLQRWKGQHVVINAALQVVLHHPAAHFLIVGGALFGIEADYPSELRALIQALGLGTKVLMTGFRTDIPAILAASDIVIVPSVHPEPFGMVTIEAMAAGKPVIGTNAGGTAEIIRRGETGLLVEPGSPTALAVAINKLLEAPGTRRAMGLRAQEDAGNRFSLARAITDIQAVYMQCIPDDV